MEQVDFVVEKISRYVFLNNSRETDSSYGARKVLVSLPRVRWLERDGLPSQYVVIADDQQPEEPTPRFNVEHHPSFGMELSAVEKQAMEFRDQGLTYAEIAQRMGVTHVSVKNYVSRGLRKTSPRPVVNSIGGASHRGPKKK